MKSKKKSKKAKQNKRVVTDTPYQYELVCVLGFKQHTEYYKKANKWE